MSSSWLIIGGQILGPYEYYFKEALEKRGHHVDYMNAAEIEIELRKNFNRISRIIRYNFYIDPALARIYREYNEYVFDTFMKMKYDVVFIYNDANVFPDTIKRMQRQGARVVLLLADDPMFVRERHWFFQDVIEADHVFVHDVEWTGWMHMMDQKNVHHLIGGSSPSVFYPVSPTEDEQRKLGADLLFVGRNYGLNADGLYRGGILNALLEFDIKIFSSSGWNGVFAYYPELERRITPRSLTLQELNAAHSACRISVALSNWGIRTGLFTRIFDVSLSGGFALAEYRRGIDEAYPGGLITQFKSLSELREMVRYYLDHEEERKSRAEAARAYTIENYTVDRLAEQIATTVLH
jgi:hypothetical protein